MTKAVRVTIGLLIAPLVPAGLLALWGAVAGGEAFLAAMAVDTFYLLLLGYPTAIIFGLPAHLALQRMGRVGWVAYLATGALAPVLTEAVYWVLIAATNIHSPPATPGAGPAGPIAYRLLDTAPSTAFLAACGMVAALAFWAVVRPDKAIASAQSF